MGELVWRFLDERIANVVSICSILEYVNYEDAEYAVRSLDGKELRGVPVHLSIDSVRCRWFQHNKILTLCAS